MIGVLALGIVAIKLTSNGEEGVLVSAPSVPPAVQDAQKASVRIWNGRGVGSGTLISASGVILTAAHVVEGAETVKVDVPDRGNLEGRVVARDSKVDLAVVKVEGGDLPFARPAPVSSTEVLYAVGYPFGGGQTITTGSPELSIRNPNAPEPNLLKMLIQSGQRSGCPDDAVLRPGNSGGGILNEKGELVGVAIRCQLGSGNGVAVDRATIGGFLRKNQDALR